jgi:pentatricopeptide repeat protein
VGFAILSLLNMLLKTGKTSVAKTLFGKMWRQVTASGIGFLALWSE